MRCNDHTDNHHYSQGFGQPRKPERVKIPDSPFWNYWRGMLDGAAEVVGGPNAKLAAAAAQYSWWLDTHEDNTGKKPTKGQRRIAQQICADYLKIPREQFIKLVKGLTGFSVDMGGGDNDN